MTRQHIYKGPYEDGRVYHNTVFISVYLQNDDKVTLDVVTMPFLHQSPPLYSKLNITRSYTRHLLRKYSKSSRYFL